MVTIRCENCSKQINIPKERLKAFEGKGILIPCPQCGFSIKYKVSKPEAILLPEDPPTQITGSPFIRTKGILEVIADDKTGKQAFDIAPGKNIIGRYSPSSGQPKGDIAIHTGDQNMSRLHCSIEVITGKGTNPIFLLSDAGSKNGTYFNSKKLDGKETLHLAHGDTIRIGGTTLVFYLVS